MRAILVGIWNGKTSKEEAKESLRELRSLVEAIGGKSMGYILQKKSKPDPRYYIGRGKAAQIREVVEGTGADTVVFDEPLSPSQVRNLEKLVGKNILDRTDLVIEIFSRRARSKEAKLQVELARLTHELPRLQGRGKEMSRLGGGVRTRGPGEQERELRRRNIKKRIHQIESELEEVKRMRRHQRKRREKDSSEEKIVKVALVGYTNAGKSTLLKAITGRDSFAADMFFATLDTKTSSRTISPRLKALFTDTVGFIKKLPTELVESFKATLEEVSEADVILHVVDISDDRWLDYVETVKEVLKELSAEEKPVIYALNKADRIVESENEAKHLPHKAFIDGEAVIVSAYKRWGIGELMEKITSFANKETEPLLVE